MVPRRTFRPRLMAGLLATAAVMAMGSLLPQTAADAATALGSLAITPATGLATSPISMATVSSGAAKGCPAPSTNIVGYVTGPGGWADGILGVNNSSAGVSLTDDFTVELADTFSGLAQSNSVTIVPGKYTITVYCADRFGVNRYGEFASPIWFTDATHYQANDPAAPVAVATSTSLSTSPASTAVAGTSVALTATVTPAAAGTVQFTDTVGASTVNIGSPVTVTGGVATAATTTLATGAHSLKAVFTPASAAAFLPSTSAATAFTVTAPVTPVISTSTALSATPVSGATAGDPVTLVAGVTPLAASGTIQFTDTIAGASTNLGTPVTVAGGSASLTTTAFGAATHTLRAVFTPSNAADYAPSTSSSLSYVVAPAVTPPASTSIALSVSPATSADVGSPVTLRAALTPAGAAGSVQFTDTVAGSTTNVGQPVAVSSGVSQLVTSSLAAGAHAFTAVFTPTDAAAYASSTSAVANYTVTGTATPPASTTLTLAATPPSPSVAGTAVTFTADVTPSAATGTVTFTEAGSATPIGSVAVAAGSAAVTTSSLAAGPHTISASFAPADPSRYAGSSSSQLQYVITAPSTPPASTSITLQAAPQDSAAAGADVILSAAIDPSGAAGTVQFLDVVAGTSTPLAAPITVQSGTATLTTRFSTAGAHTIRALFTPADPAAFAASASSDLMYTVTPAQNPEAKPTSTVLYGWPTWWCPPNGYQALQSSGGKDGNDGEDSHRHRHCQGGVLVARVRPGSAPGTVQFTDTTGRGTVKPLGGPVTVSGGWAVLFITVTRGWHTYSAAFVPQDPAVYQPSTSNELHYGRHGH